MKGFTLFELLLAMSVSLILAFTAAPAWHHWVARNKTAEFISRMVTAIHAARSEAVAREENVVFCGSGDGVHCDGRWQSGQLTMLDHSQKVLRIYPATASGDRFWWKSSLGYNDALKLAPTGFTAGQRGSFYYCPHYKPERYGAKIVVSDSARLRVETGVDDLQQICAG